ncbi:hypothetical protein Pfo_018569 [Paulownia fortunei]|nr:hypothetical protein Pfo_018569 [Paulownia fortunei]
MNGTPEKFVEERREKYKSQVFKTSLMGERVAVLSGPAGNKFLYANENKVVGIWLSPSMKKLLGKCIITTAGDEGKIMRNMVSYFMSPDACSRLYIRNMNLVSLHHINTHWQGKEEVKVFPTMKLYSFELASRLFMSLEDADLIARLATLFNIVLKGLISLPVNFPGTRFYKAKKAVNAIKNQLQKIVRQRRADLEQKTATPLQDILSHLLTSPDENGMFMSESVIVNNILMLIFAAHDPPTSAITMLMKNLAEYPEIYEEVLRANEIASSKATGEFLQWEDIQKMRYSWNVVSETMRLTPPVIGSFREAVADIHSKGWKLYWSPSLTHRDPSFFPDHLKFDPSRFEATGPTPFSYVPFGGGPRICLGQEFARVEILIFLHHVITRFRWKLVIPDEKIEYDPTPIPAKGLPICLHSHTAQVIMT